MFESLALQAAQCLQPAGGIDAFLDSPHTQREKKLFWLLGEERYFILKEAETG